MRKDRQLKGKVMLCDTAARNIKRTIMKNVKEAESDIASACSIFHKKHEQKTGRPIVTIGEFERVTEEFSKLPRSEIEILIKEGKEADKIKYEAIEADKIKYEAIEAIRKSHVSK
jgi:hypothetical protein